MIKKLLFNSISSKMRHLAYSQPNPVSLKILNKIDAKPKIPFSFWQESGVNTSKIGQCSINLYDEWPL